MFFTWVRAGDIDVKIEEVDPNELDLILQRFYTEVKNKIVMIMSPTLWQICRLRLIATLRIKDTNFPL